MVFYLLKLKHQIIYIEWLCWLLCQKIPWTLNNMFKYAYICSDAWYYCMQPVYRFFTRVNFMDWNKYCPPCTWLHVIMYTFPVDALCTCQYMTNIAIYSRSDASIEIWDTKDHWYQEKVTTWWNLTKWKSSFVTNSGLVLLIVRLLSILFSELPQTDRWRLYR